MANWFIQSCVHKHMNTFTELHLLTTPYTMFIIWYIDQHNRVQSHIETPVKWFVHCLFWVQCWHFMQLSATVHDEYETTSYYEYNIPNSDHAKWRSGPPCCVTFWFCMCFSGLLWLFSSKGKCKCPWRSTAALTGYSKTAIETTLPVYSNTIFSFCKSSPELQ